MKSPSCEGLRTFLEPCTLIGYLYQCPIAALAGKSVSGLVSKRNKIPGLCCSGIFLQDLYAYQVLPRMGGTASLATFVGRALLILLARGAIITWYCQRDPVPPRGGKSPLDCLFLLCWAGGGGGSQRMLALGNG